MSEFPVDDIALGVRQILQSMCADAPDDRPAISVALAELNALLSQLTGAEEWLGLKPDHPMWNRFLHAV